LFWTASAGYTTATAGNPLNDKSRKNMSDKEQPKINCSVPKAAMADFNRDALMALIPRPV
jgi:hypothetical protein